MTEADGHAFMTLQWLTAIGPQKTVPPWQVEAEIAVGFPDDHGMVDPVHFRRNHKKAQDSVQTSWKANVPVIEHARAVQEYLKQEDGHSRGPQKDHGSHLDRHGDQDFQGVEAEPVVTSKSRSEWCIICIRHKVGRA